MLSKVSEGHASSLRTTKRGKERERKGEMLQKYSAFIRVGGGVPRVSKVHSVWLVENTEVGNGSWEGNDEVPQQVMLLDHPQCFLKGELHGWGQSGSLFSCSASHETSSEMDVSFFFFLALV